MSKCKKVFLSISAVFFALFIIVCVGEGHTCACQDVHMEVRGQPTGASVLSIHHVLSWDLNS